MQKPPQLGLSGRCGPGPRFCLFLAAGTYLVSSWVQAPVEPDLELRLPGVVIGRVAISPPLVLSGDPPHYLVAASSLVQDLDWDVSNNYQRARLGGWDAGARFRSVTLDPHADLDTQGRLIPTHSPFFSLLLAWLGFPFRHSAWLEPVLIWSSMAAGLCCLFWLSRHTEQGWWVLALALATPLWCYSRDLWTEPFVAVAWLVLLSTKHPATLFLGGLLGTWLKFPFALVPAVMAGLAWRRGRRSEALSLALSAVVGLATAVAFVQFLFRDVDHASLFHSGIHGAFDLPLDGLVGLLFSPENGLLFFFPVLFWAARPLWNQKEILLPVAAFVLAHASYEDWMGGTGFSARYLVPLLPILFRLMSGVVQPTFLFRIALGYSLFWGIVGGLAPALVYDRTPWGAVLHFVQRLSGG